MTSSGTYNFSPSNGELVLAAYERIQIRAPSIRQEHMLSARRELNFLFIEWDNRQVNLWKIVRDQQTLTSGTATYSVPARTIMILDASRVLNFGTSSESRLYMMPISRTEYLSYPNQQIQAQPLVYWFDRLISPTVTFWPVPDDNGPYVFDYFRCEQIQDANLSGGETPDTVQRWFDAIVAGMAHRLSRIYPPQGVDAVAFEKMRESDAERAWTIAATQDTENVPVKLIPQIVAYYGR